MRSDRWRYRSIEDWRIGRGSSTEINFGSLKDNGEHESPDASTGDEDSEVAGGHGAFLFSFRWNGG